MSDACWQTSLRAAEQALQRLEIRSFGQHRIGKTVLSRPEFFRDHRAVHHPVAMPAAEHIVEYLGCGLPGFVQSLRDCQAQAVSGEAGRDAAGDFAVRIHRQAEQDDLRLGGFLLQRGVAAFHDRAEVPDADIVSCGKQVFHRVAHFAVAQNQYTFLHRATSFG